MLILSVGRTTLLPVEQDWWEANHTDVTVIASSADPRDSEAIAQEIVNLAVDAIAVRNPNLHLLPAIEAAIRSERNVQVWQKTERREMSRTRSTEDNVLFVGFTVAYPLS